MLTPSKFTTFDESVLGKLPALLNEGIKEEPLLSAYERTKHIFGDTGEFMYAIDTLYILGKATINFDSGIINYAD